METIDISSNKRNVLDKFKSWTDTEIKSEVQNKSIPGAVAMFHLNGDFNISTLLRNTNFFNLTECIYVGKRSWDRRGAVGTQNYTKLSYCESVDKFWQYVEDNNYCPIGIENNVNYDIKNLYNFDFPYNPLFIFGEECEGLSSETLDKCRYIVSIPDYGSVRSVNVGTASGIIMSEYRRQLFMEEVNAPYHS